MPNTCTKRTRAYSCCCDLGRKMYENICDKLNVKSECSREGENTIVPLRYIVASNKVG